MTEDDRPHNGLFTTGGHAATAPPRPYANGTTINGSGGGSTKRCKAGEDDAEEDPVDKEERSLRDVCKDIHDRVQRFLRIEPASDADGDVIRRTQRQTRISQGVIQRALVEYGFEHLSFSYNGGKDCLVLLLLYLSVLWTHFAEEKNRLHQGQDPKPSNTHTDTHTHPEAANGVDSSSDFPSTIASIYAEPPDPFPAPPVVSFRDAFAQYLDQHSPRIKAIFVGTRRTDPHGHKLTFFDLTDGAWPRFMRVHPVLEWRLDEIWCFLRSRELGGQWMPLEYCSMYDEGYTSLGGTGDTLRNPRLKVLEPGGGVSWRPAYQMVDDERERDGRE
ncbi:hypothetical protein DV735_g1558, partial [Chaetothyriales sp. CBS 134920]